MTMFNQLALFAYLNLCSLLPDTELTKNII